MKLTYSRRYRYSPSRSGEKASPKKEGPQEHGFFSAPGTESFFKPAPAIQRKCAHCEAEDKTVKRMAADSQEEKKIQKLTDKKEEEKISREPVNKEEEKVQKMEDKQLHRVAEKKEEEKTVAKKQVGPAPPVNAATGAYIRSLSGKGSLMPAGTREFFSARMGHDFSKVRIHTDFAAEQSATAINAKAYCIENNIVFNRGQYNPGSAEGKRLLAHELTHVIQKQGNDPGLLSRVAALNEHQEEEGKPIGITGKGTKNLGKSAHGCAGVNVQGQTDANYSSSFATSGKTKSSTACTDCAPPDCVSTNGAVISTFTAKPVITLPDVPDGLTACEEKAVRKFINGTLKRHEQQHVQRFRTYEGTVRTPLKFTGCRAELNSQVQAIHDGIDSQRAAEANAYSDKLDPFNVTIPCNCETQQK
jgi:hypothetical protein